MEWGKQMEKHQENAKLSLYQNTNYTFERKEKKSLILDVIINDATGGKGVSPPTFDLVLPEPLIVDKLSDIYLDSFSTIRFKQNGETSTCNMGFILKIDQFNIQSVVATNLSHTSGDVTHFTNRINGGIFIPNEATGTINEVNTSIHKGKKMNYICSINPTKINKITGSISDMGVKSATLGGTVRFSTAADPVFYGNPFAAGDTTGTPARFIAEFIIVARDKE
jgi:hypothetical protein